MPRVYKSLFLVVATSATVMVAARDGRHAGDTRGFVRGMASRKLKSKSKGDDAPVDPMLAVQLPVEGMVPLETRMETAAPTPPPKSSKKGESTDETLLGLPVAWMPLETETRMDTAAPTPTPKSSKKGSTSDDPLFALPVEGMVTDLRIDTAAPTPTPKGSKKGGTTGSDFFTEIDFRIDEETKAPKQSKKGSYDVLPPPEFRVEVPLDVELFTEERVDIFANETFANETFANETDVFTNETLPPTERFINDTLPPTELSFANETVVPLAGNETAAPERSIVNAVRLKLFSDESCVSYNESSVEALSCDAAGGLADWEVLESSEPGLFQLRHIESELCLPENPESPDQPFSCWITETDKAIGDTINGLVNCTSPFAAFVGFIDPANPTYIYNAICSTGTVGAPSDVVLMAYTSNGSTELLWGEKILLDVPQMTANATYLLTGSFFLAEA